MTLRKLSAFAPLAVLVGSAIHVAVAGFDHAPGGGAAFEISGWVVLALGLALSAAFFAGATGSARSSVATKAGHAYGSLVLALGGTAVYAALEVLEGHLHAGGALRALAVSLPIAALVLAIARRAGGCATVAGARFAATLRSRRLPAACRVAGFRRRTLVPRHVGADARRGRAPPLFA